MKKSDYIVIILLLLVGIGNLENFMQHHETCILEKKKKWIWNLLYSFISGTYVIY